MKYHIQKGFGTLPNPFDTYQQAYQKAFSMADRRMRELIAIYSIPNGEIRIRRLNRYHIQIQALGANGRWTAQANVNIKLQ